MLIAEETSILIRRGRSAPATVLTPAQDAAATGLLKSLALGAVFVLRAETGAGRTSVLRYIHSRTGGAFLGMRQFIDMLMVRRPDAIEQAFVELLEDALANHQIVLLDDLHLLTAVTDNCCYQRCGLLNAALEAILGNLLAEGKKLIFGTGADDIPPPIRARAWVTTIRKLGAADYEAIVLSRMRGVAPSIDYDRIYLAAPALNGHQLDRAAAHCAREEGVSTDGFLAYLSAHDLTSNVELEEVQPVRLTDLKGVDDLVEALEANIALPFENLALASELKLKPKRGVLLAGPPGTGKTTIGRALAHRLKGKFFLIDGTVIAGTNSFHSDVEEVFERAKKNAPAVIFIDDADVLFEDHRAGNNAGLYRYLLTMLDGLESASNERVCVMMTAMDVGSLPPALLRSGRVELWLETRLPDEAARAAILREKFSSMPEPIASADIAALASASRGLTGADLKAVVDDGKLRFAYDLARGRTTKPVEDYFLEAMEEVRANRRKYSRSKPPRLTEEGRFGFSVDC